MINLFLLFSSTIAVSVAIKQYLEIKRLNTELLDLHGKYELQKASLYVNKDIARKAAEAIATMPNGEKFEVEIPETMSHFFIDDVLEGEIWLVDRNTGATLQHGKGTLEKRK